MSSISEDGLQPSGVGQTGRRLFGGTRNRQRIRTGAVLVAAAVAITVIGFDQWGAQPLTVSSVVAAIVAGLSLGSIYALAAAGLVVTYTTTGVFNFAQGAIGTFMAFLFWQFNQAWGVNEYLAILITVLVLAPLTGIVVERLVMRRAAQGSLVTKLMMSVALLVFLMGLTGLIWNQNSGRSVPYLFGQSGFSFDGTFILWDSVLVIAVGVGIAIGLRYFLKKTRIGLAMRAAVDNPTLAAMHGARPQRVAAMSWALSTSMAALAGILIAPQLTLSIQPLTLLIIDAFAAAIIGRLKNLPMTIVGGLLIGLLYSFASSFLKFQGNWSNMPEAIPSIVLFFALLALPAAPILAKRREGRLHVRVPTVWRGALGAGVFVVLMYLISTGMALTTQNLLAAGLTTVLVLLPLIPLIGWAGQVALAPLAFAGIGAFAMVEWAHSGSLLGLVLAAALALPFGLVMAVPALRLDGLYLALASVAFADILDDLFFSQAHILGDQSNVVHHPTIFGISFGGTQAFIVLTSIAVGVITVGLVALRRAKFGRHLVAMRDSSVACTTIGLDIRKLKLSVFLLASGLGAVGGAFMAMQGGTPSATDFNMFSGLTLVLFLVLGGVTLATGAMTAGLAGTFFHWLTSTFPSTFITAVNDLAPAGIAGAVAKNPNGIAGTVAAKLGRFAPWERQDPVRGHLDLDADRLEQRAVGKGTESAIAIVDRELAAAEGDER